MPRSMPWFISLLCGLLGVPSICSAQAPLTPAFEVASVKQNKSSGNIRPPVLHSTGGRLTLTNMPLDALIRTAYQLQPLQTGGWTLVDRLRQIRHRR